MPEKKKQQSPGEIYDRRAMALARALEAQRDGGDPRGKNARMDDRSFALAQAARRAIAKEQGDQYGFGAPIKPLAAGERGLDRLAPYSEWEAAALAEPEVRTPYRRFGQDSTYVTGYTDETAMRDMLRRTRRPPVVSQTEEERMRATLGRPGEGRGNVLATDLPLSVQSQPVPGDLIRDPGLRSGLVPTPPYMGDYQGSYDLEASLYGAPMGSGASAGQRIPAYEGGVSRFMPERLPEYRQSLRHGIAYESMGPSDGKDPTARANLAYADSPAGKRPFSPGERERLAAPQKRAAKKGK